MASRTKRREIQAMKKTVIKIKRPKTFKTEEAANTWAKAQGIGKYTLQNIKSPEAATKKIRVIAE
ncbi:hypothetical protein HN587_05075 [Candidatus Woesearchaeota archaeon]|jgi:hypothetical protein|nr:hypothetical protein [Candidatus Woesearchaeota archaeon]